MWGFCGGVGSGSSGGDRIGQEGTGTDWIGKALMDWTGGARRGADRSGPDRTGPNGWERIGQERNGVDRTGAAGTQRT